MTYDNERNIFVSFSVEGTIIYLNMEKTLSYNYNYEYKTIQGLYVLMDQFVRSSLIDLIHFGSADVA